MSLLVLVTSLSSEWVGDTPEPLDFSSSSPRRSGCSPSTRCLSQDYRCCHDEEQVALFCLVLSQLRFLWGCVECEQGEPEGRGERGRPIVPETFSLNHLGSFCSDLCPRPCGGVGGRGAAWKPNGTSTRLIHSRFIGLHMKSFVTFQ